MVQIPRLKAILDLRPRVEKVAWKDVKLRTFITEDSSRDELVSHVYDITHGSVKPTDHLVAIDDSIVRGTTLKQSILRIFDRLSPKHIVIASSSIKDSDVEIFGRIALVRWIRENCDFRTVFR